MEIQPLGSWKLCRCTGHCWKLCRCPAVFTTEALQPAVLAAVPAVLAAVPGNSAVAQNGNSAVCPGNSAVCTGNRRISNACPSCGFFSSEHGDWVRCDAGWVFLYHQHGVVKKGSKQGSKKNQKKQQKKQQKQVSFALTLGLFCFDTRSLLL